MPSNIAPSTTKTNPLEQKKQTTTRQSIAPALQKAENVLACDTTTSPNHALDTFLCETYDSVHPYRIAESDDWKRSEYKAYRQSQCRQKLFLNTLSRDHPNDVTRAEILFESKLINYHFGSALLPDTLIRHWVTDDRRSNECLLHIARYCDAPNRLSELSEARNQKLPHTEFVNLLWMDKFSPENLNKIILHLGAIHTLGEWIVRGKHRFDGRSIPWFLGSDKADSENQVAFLLSRFDHPGTSREILKTLSHWDTDTACALWEALTEPKNREELWKRFFDRPQADTQPPIIKDHHNRAWTVFEGNFCRVNQSGQDYVLASAQGKSMGRQLLWDEETKEWIARRTKA